VILKTNRELKLPSGLKLDIIKKGTKLISHQKRRMETGFFKKNIPSIGINEVRLWVSTRKNVRNAAGGDRLPSWMKPITTPAARLKFFVRIAVAAISGI
jgi:hypothetical protein